MAIMSGLNGIIPGAQARSAGAEKTRRRLTMIAALNGWSVTLLGGLCFLLSVVWFSVWGLLVGAVAIASGCMELQRAAPRETRAAGSRPVARRKPTAAPGRDLHLRRGAVPVAQAADRLERHASGIPGSAGPSHVRAGVDGEDRRGRSVVIRRGDAWHAAVPGRPLPVLYAGYAKDFAGTGAGNGDPATFPDHAGGNRNSEVGSCSLNRRRASSESSTA